MPFVRFAPSSEDALVFVDPLVSVFSTAQIRFERFAPGSNALTPFERRNVSFHIISSLLNDMSVCSGIRFA